MAEVERTIPQDIKEQMVAVLREFANIGVIGQAFDNCGVRRRNHYTWLERYPKYKERFEEVRSMFVDGLESIAIQRAKEKSDALLMMMLKAHRREIYGDRNEITHMGQGQQIQLIFAEGMLTDAEKEMLKKDKE